MQSAFYFQAIAHAAEMQPKHQREWASYALISVSNRGGSSGITLPEETKTVPRGDPYQNLSGNRKGRRWKGNAECRAGCSSAFSSSVPPRKFVAAGRPQYLADCCRQVAFFLGSNYARRPTGVDSHHSSPVRDAELKARTRLECILGLLGLVFYFAHKSIAIDVGMITGLHARMSRYLPIYFRAVSA
jgi:hypothetical protein